MLRPIIASLALVGVLSASSAFAQAPASPGPGMAPAGSVGSTADGMAPAKAASTTAVGQTKPPGTAADGSRPDLDQKSRELDRKIKTGICTGCK